jgi:hypothetical protein
MANTHGTAEALHVVLSKDIPNQSFALALAKLATTTCNDPRRILTAMLQYRQGIVDLRGDI